VELPHSTDSNKGITQNKVTGVYLEIHSRWKSLYILGANPGFSGRGIVSIGGKYNKCPKKLNQIREDLDVSTTV